jgi:hypothetical protein
MSSPRLRLRTVAPFSYSERDSLSQVDRSSTMPDCQLIGTVVGGFVGAGAPSGVADRQA